MNIYKFWTYNRHLDRLERFVIAETKDEAEKYLNEKLIGQWNYVSHRNIISPMIVDGEQR
jgi:hypothetical protein